MRLFIIGDYKTGTGPANVTAALIKKLPRNTLVLKSSGKLMRLLELIFKMPFCTHIVLSGHSKQNIYALKLAAVCRKKSIFIMHGCVEHENALNGVPDEDMNRVERKVLAESNLILAVSPVFEEWLKTNYSEYADKIKCLVNGVEWEAFCTASDNAEDAENGKKNDFQQKNLHKNDSENQYIITSVGGGMPRKKIAVLCEAVEILCNQGVDCLLYVAGAKGKDTSLLEKSDRCIDLGLIDRKKLKSLLHQSDLYIQNSSFETFGLAPIEALCSGCNVLFSKNIGALCIFDNTKLSTDDIIDNCVDAAEIATKIKAVLESPNHDRLMEAIDRANTGYDTRAEELLKFAEEM